jgi:peroxiredoxin
MLKSAAADAGQGGKRHKGAAYTPANAHFDPCSTAAGRRSSFFQQLVRLARRVRRALPFAALLLLAGAAYAAAPVPGDAAPDFTLKSLSGENLRLSEQRGSVVVMHFFASWCSPCRQEMPQLEALYQKFQAAGLLIFAVSLDEDFARSRTMAQDLGVSYPVLHDQRKTVSERYQINDLPTTWFVDRDGKLRYVHSRFEPGFEQRYANELRKLLAE